MYSFTSTVRFSECDEEGRLTIPSLINYLQDCSTFHTESLGHGIGYTYAHGFSWFIMAWNIEVERMPRFLEPLRVSTWVHSMRPTSSGRFFTVDTQDGGRLVKADSFWVAYDVRHGRPMRIPDSEKVLLSDDEPLAMPPLKRKITLFGDGDPQDAVTVVGEHLDANHHVNNGRYVAMAASVLKGRPEASAPRRIQVQYKQAARLGDVIVPYVYTHEAGSDVDLSDGRGNSFAIVRLCTQ